MATLPHPASSPPGQSNHRTADALAGLELLPSFEWYQVGQPIDRVAIRGELTGSGDRLIRLPYRIVDSSARAQGVRIQTVPDGWVLDVNQAGIDIGGLIGGRVDGTTIVANEECAVWGHVDPFDPVTPFRGFSITRMPLETGTCTAAALGPSTTVVTVGTPGGLRFPIGSRVRVFQSVTVYNTGTVTATTATTVTVDLDALYGAGLTQPNAALAAAACTLRQIDGFQPLTAEGTIYGGYSYCYLGSLVNSANAIRWVRTRGTWRNLPVALALQTTVVGTAVTQLCTASAVPNGAPRVGLSLSTSNGTGYVTVGPDITSPFVIGFWGANVPAGLGRGWGSTTQQTRDTSVFVDRFQSGGVAWTVTISATGYDSPVW